MNLAFVIIAILIVAGATAAMTLRNLVHSALSLTCALGGVAFLYLLLGVQFVGFAQFLVYIGAVAILIVFAILITRGIESTGEAIFAPGRWAGWASSLLMFAVLAGAVCSSRALPGGTAAVHEPTVREIGNLLMTRYVLPLEIIGLLLTAALIGGVLVASKPSRARPGSASDGNMAAGTASKEVT